jgi:ferredoxin
MPDRYHIHAVPQPAQFPRVGKFGSVDWREDCSRCTNCVKPRCLYDVYRNEAAYNRDPFSSVRTLDGCRACLSCVQGCTKGLLNIAPSPEYLGLGDDYWKPEVILSTWNQADAGKIPVSGAGYRGRFHGPGFDSIWTDMSEIVRPTRDGIHGREYISTSVDIGPKPLRLQFTPDGKLLSPPARLIEIQLPAILDLPVWQMPGANLAAARIAAAKALKTLAVVTAGDGAQALPKQLPAVMPLVTKGSLLESRDILESVHIAQIWDGPDAPALAAELLAINPDLIAVVRMPLSPASADRVMELTRAGIRVFQVCAGLHGREQSPDGRPGRHLKDALREVHGRLVKEGIRDETTLIVSGGIALAEHLAKAIICGADLVAVDTALLVALGCRVCRGRQHPSSHCPAGLDSLGSDGYAAQRLVNLMSAWHSQLIEVLGAMGIREVRRLRGEVGRAIFMEEIEKEAFGGLRRVSRAQVSA